MSAAPTVPVSVAALQLAWNDNRGKRLPEWRETNAKRLKAAKARVSERTPEQWVEVVQRIASSDFCCGINQTGWRAGVDFFLRADTAAKVLEGNYDNRSSTRPGAPVAPDASQSEFDRLAAAEPDIVKRSRMLMLARESA